MLFKIAYTDWEAELPFMLQILAACSVIIWIRTLLLVPCKTLNPNVPVSEQSFVGLCCKRTTRVDEEKEDNEDEKVETSNQVKLADFWPSIRSINTWQFTAFYTLLSCRVKSIQG